MSVKDFTAHRQLRKKAESPLPRISKGLAPVDTFARLLHELRVHQVELEMQNDELRSAQVELAKMRDRYVDLFEFAPIAYITLTASGEIAHINQTGASLLQADRRRLCGLLLEKFVMANDQAIWRRFWNHPREHGHQQTCELTMLRQDGTYFFGSLCAALVSGVEGLPELRIALTDISDRKNAEQARRKFEARLSKLTKREREILALALAGMTNKDISARIHISQRAVENYRSRIHAKTESVSLLELSHQVATAGMALEEINQP